MEAAKGGRAGVRAATLSVVVVTAALALTGCETTAEKSAALERTAHHSHLAERGLSITKQSADVRVLGAVLVHGAEGAAVVVTLRNDTAHAYKNVPIAITVKNAHGSTIFQNNAPGLEPALTSLGSMPAHSEATWVDDQVPGSGGPASVSAIAGESPIASGPVPRIEVADVHPSEESGTATAAGTVRNRSNVAQQALVVYVIARRAGRIVAAGRAILPEVSSGVSVPFQAFLVGASARARLEANAPASTFG
jgi:hypothetical protein